VLGDQTWILIEGDPSRGLGGALAWARQHRTSQVHVIADSHTGVLARRAAFFATDVTVWQANGRALVAAVPEPLAEPVPVAAEHLAFVEVIEAAGVEPVIEHGVLTGEVEGLEVCRVVFDEALGTDRLEVGVGMHDRLAFQMLNGDVPTAAALARVAESVRVQRQPGVNQHPLNTLAAERMLFCRIRREPSLVGLARLDRIQPPAARGGIKETWPILGVGERIGNGAPVVVGVSTGVDLDLVPFAADGRAAEAARRAMDESELGLVLALPARDALSVTRDLATSLRNPAEVVGL
jgi:hypothetical protein